MKLKIISTFAIAIILASCARWEHLDGSKAGLDDITKAKLACDYDASLLALQTRQLRKDTAVATTSDLEEKKALEEAYERAANEVYSKLNACMKDRGLKKIQ